MTNPRPAAGGHIVVGVDGSEASQHALRWAAFLARAADTTIDAVTAWESPLAWSGLGWAGPPIEWNPEAEARTMLRQTLAEVFDTDLPSTLRSTVSEGSAAKVLIERTHDARMLVVGSRGHGGFAGLMLGSVSTACAEHATCPVLVVHGDTPPPPD